MEQAMRLLRSLLFTPGNRPRMLEKAAGTGADAVIIDLEDSVPVAEKEATRPLARQAIDTIAKASAVDVYVRANPAGGKTAYSVDFAAADIAAVMCANLAGVIVPKVEAAEEVAGLAQLMLARERQLGLPEGGIELIPMLETAKGIVNALDIARAAPGRVARLAFGAGDLTFDLGISWTPDETELMYARSHLVMVSRAAGLEQPIDAVWANIQDEEGLRRSAAMAKQLGFQGKTCIHPGQIAIINQVFSPDPAEVEDARGMVAAFAQAEREGTAAIKYGGRMVDYPVAARARQLVELADAIAARRAARQT